MKNKILTGKIIKISTTLAAVVMLGLTGCSNDDNEPIELVPYVAGTESPSSNGVAASDMQNINIEAMADYDSTGVVYYIGNPYEYNYQAPCRISFGQITSSVQDGTKTLTLPVTMQMQGSYDTDCIDYSDCLTPSFELADKYTGVIFPTRRALGSSGYAYSGSVVSEGNSINVTYTCDYSCEEGDWKSVGDDVFAKDIIINVTYQISMPESYDGLVLKVTPLAGYFEENAEQNTPTEYLTDVWPEGTRVFTLI